MKIEIIINFIMRKYLVILFGIVSMSLHAEGLNIGAESLNFGTPYLNILTNVEAEWGKPTTNDDGNIHYCNVALYGTKWDEVGLFFKNGVLVEARCYVSQKNKLMATRKLSTVARMMKDKHAMTCDYEEDGSLFYVGGKSPNEIGHLFTLFIAPHQGKWSTQLRFGPFSY